MKKPKKYRIKKIVERDQNFNYPAYRVEKRGLLGWKLVAIFSSAEKAARKVRELENEKI